MHFCSDHYIYSNFFPETVNICYVWWFLWMLMQFIVCFYNFQRLSRSQLSTFTAYITSIGRLLYPNILSNMYNINSCCRFFLISYMLSTIALVIISVPAFLCLLFFVFLLKTAISTLLFDDCWYFLLFVVFYWCWIIHFCKILMLHR